MFLIDVTPYEKFIQGMGDIGQYLTNRSNIIFADELLIDKEQ